MDERICGLTWEQIQAAQQGKVWRESVDTAKLGDYGADPVGDGTFRMVPSGDVVDWAERCKRLGK